MAQYQVVSQHLKTNELHHSCVYDEKYLELAKIVKSSWATDPLLKVWIKETE